MKLRSCCLYIFLSNINLCYASFPLFDDPDINTLFIESTYHQVYKQDGEALNINELGMNPLMGNDITILQTLWIDVENERMYKDDRLSSYTDSLPEQIHVYIDGTLRIIRRFDKSVITDDVGFPAITSFLQLKGWFHDGINLFKYRESLALNQFEKHRDGLRSFTLSPPEVRLPVRCFVNLQNRVVKIHHYEQRTESGNEDVVQTLEKFEWGKMRDRDFWYPSRNQGHVTLQNGMTLDIDVQVKKIKVNEPIPDGLFDVENPPGYDVINR